MDLAARYNLVEKLFEGEFAAVFRAEDRELGREVAIKQFHEQYLHDPAQLERYWQEAQLLASLDHPYIVTVHDVDRRRGWLIMELMQGSLEQSLRGQPVDLDQLRVVLICGLHAIRVLEENGIVHGDIKPGNLLLDRAGRVKLGDFGIARRIQGEGSLVKGTTKYMAPEVVSDQYGPVGSHSDLYSLGFTAYELMCGRQFETLFPGLDMYGGNRQMAWIMWHAAADRRLPEIDRVLQGVPEDLRFVIEKLLEKDPQKRYRHPDEALADLRQKANLPGARPPEPAEPAAPSGMAKWKRYFAGGALAASVLLSLVVLFTPTSAPPPVVQEETLPEAGVLRHIDTERSEIVVDPAGGGTPVRIAYSADRDIILLDDTRKQLGELQEGDRLEIHRSTMDDGTRKLEIIATRDIVQQQGRIAAVDTHNATLTLSTDEGKIVLAAPRSAKITLNGQETVGRSPLQLAHIQEGDQAQIRHVPGEGQRQATAIQLLRILPITGTIEAIDAEHREVTIRVAGGERGQLRTFPVAEGATVTVLQPGDGGSQAGLLGDLRRGDVMQGTHDSHLLSIQVSRESIHSGIVEQVDPADGLLAVRIEGREMPVSFAVSESTEIRLRFPGELVAGRLAQLRAGDAVTITHESPSLESPRAAIIEVQPALNNQAWALILAQQEYLDGTVLPRVEDDARLLRRTLAYDYRIPAEKILLLENVNRSELATKVADQLRRVPAGSQLIACYLGQGLFGAGERPLITAQDFDRNNPGGTAVPLAWLVTEMERSKAEEKVLLLDTCRGGSETAAEPSAAELAEALKPNPRRPVSSSVLLIASCSAGQQAQPSTDGAHSRFAEQLALAFAGQADANDNDRISSQELTAFLTQTFADASLGQTPRVFLPDATPERLTEEAKKGIRRLLAHLDASQLRTDELRGELASLRRLAPEEPEFQLAGALVLLKHGKTSFAKELFEEVLVEHPDALLAHEALAWLALLSKEYRDGLRHMERVAGTMHDPAAENELARHSRHLVRWLGALSGYLQQVVPESRKPPTDKLAELIARHGEQATQLYEQGQSEVAQQKDQVRKAFEQALTDSSKARLRIKALSLATYATFDYDAAKAYMLARLEY